MKLWSLLFFVFASIGIADTPPVNVVFILTDNHGAWTLGCYGNPDIKTPNIDRMAAEGAQFTHAFCNNAVCSPTRATYLTGLMPSQHGVHNFLRGGRLQTGPEARNTLAEFRSLPEILTDAGYACGLIGKWHLGGNMEPQENLDDAWITMPHGGTSTFHGAQIIENGALRKEDEHLTTFWTKHALQFIEEQQEDPFFLFLSYNGPYGLSRFQLEPLRGPRADDYTNAEMTSFPGGVIHPWEYNNREYFGNLTAKRRYAAELSAIDDGVGSVIDKLKELGLDENTLVVFAADQGWAGGHRGFWGMGDHTRPLNAYEHSMRIPLIFRHPKSIPPGRKPNILTSNYDFLPSILGYLDLAEQMPSSPISPGRDYSSVLRGKTISNWKDEVFYEYENLRCIRTRDWKYIERYEDGYDELYDLEADPEELNNLAGSDEAKTIQAQLQKRLDGFFATHVIAKYDLWNGGESQPKTLVWGEEAEARMASWASRAGVAPSPFDVSWNPPPFELPEDYIAEVVAAPPLVEHPMMATFDDEGRLYVAEASGVNLNKADLEKELPNRIRRLVDTNNDGIFDQSTIFAEDMSFPQGALWLNGALYVASPPGIWMLIDSDNDGVSDYRAQLVDGFDYTGNAADVHGPFLHPSGRLYWCHGRKGHRVLQRDGRTLVSEGKGARIWSMRPDGSDIQVHAGGGMDNPVELDFTDEGEIVGSVNLFYGRPRGDVLVHWLYGGRYPRNDQTLVLEEFANTGPVLTEAHNFGHVAVSGMTIQRDETKPGELTILSAMFNTQHIEKTQLHWDGATLRSKSSSSLLKIHNSDVHLTDVLEDVDGSLLAIDTGGWFRIGCPNSQLAKPEIPGAIYRIRKAGIRDRETDFRGIRLDWENATIEQLSTRLADSRRSVQERAIRSLALRGDEALDSLAAATSAANEQVRRNAVWAATRIGSPEALELVRAMTEDKSSSVAIAACNSIIATGDPGAVDWLASTLQAANQKLRRAAASAMGRTRDPAAIPYLTKLLDQPLDRATQHAATFALIEIGDFEATKKHLSAASEAAGAILLALDEMKESKLTFEDVKAFLNSPSSSHTALEIASRHPEWSVGLTNYLDVGYLDSPNDTWTEQLQVLAPAMIENPEMIHLLSKLLRDRTQHDTVFTIIAALPERIPLPESWREPFLSKLNSEGGLRAASKVVPDAIQEELTAIAEDPAVSDHHRFLALRGLSTNATLSNNGFQLLLRLLGDQSTPTERAETIALLADFRLSKAQLIDLAPSLQNSSLVDFRGLLSPFLRSRDLEVGTALAKAIVDSPASSSIPTTELRRILNRYPVEAQQMAEVRLSKLEKEAANQLKKLESLSSRVQTEGDPVRGSQVFSSGLGACITCHQIGKTGISIGPDLTQIGRIRTVRDLLESILFPGSSIARDFEAYSVRMTSGQMYSGLISDEAEDGITLVLAGGAETQLKRTEIESMIPAAHSFMPKGLEKGMTERQLLDLVAFLKDLN